METSELERAIEDQARIMQAAEREAAELEAHDFGTSQSVVHSGIQLATGYVEALVEQGIIPPEDYASLSNVLAIAKSAAKRSDVIAKSIITPREYKPEKIYINRLLEALIKSLKILPDAASVKVFYSPGTEERLYADPIDVYRIVMNLCANAIKFMSDKSMSDGGKLKIKTLEIKTYDFAIRCSSEHEAATGTGITAPGYALTTGNYVVIEVRDTGTGIKPGLLEKMFEPHVTSDRQNGTGLGLAIADKLTRRNLGGIEAHTELGNGTTFRVYLPTVQR